jgi:hypothetical protein
MTTRRTTKPRGGYDPFYRNPLFIAILAPLIVSVILSLSTWIAFQSVVTVKLDSLNEGMRHIEAVMMPKEQIVSSIHDLTDRLGKDEADIDEVRKQLHEDEMNRSKGR